MKRVLLLPLLASVACGVGPHGHEHGAGGHTHGGGHEHGGGHGHGDAEGESIAVTRWTDTHELFVELDAPVAGHPFAYHAHVTRLADNHAATRGVYTIRFEREGQVVASHRDEGVARAGIFAEEAAAPDAAGTYRLVMTYEDGSERATWDAGTVQVGGRHAVVHEGEDEGEIPFLKETQWQIPFRVAPAEERPVAPVVIAPAVVVPDPATSAVVAAQTGGLVVWQDGLPVPGRVVERGERLATLLPSGAADHWTRIRAERTQAAVGRDLAQSELARVEGLVERDLLPARRLEEARAALARAEAELSGARGRLASLDSSGGGGVTVRAPASGTIVAVGADHGTMVAPGAPLVTIQAGEGVLVEGTVHERTATVLSPLASLTVQRGDWEAPRDLLEAGGRLVTETLVFDPETLSAPVTARLDRSLGLRPGDLVELGLGIGAPAPVLAVPRSAVVEVNGRAYVFVQRTGESFTRRAVTLGPADAAHVAVLSGLAPGEMVVVEGGFDVHVASLSGALESHRH